MTEHNETADAESLVRYTDASVAYRFKMWLRKKLTGNRPWYAEEWEQCQQMQWRIKATVGELERLKEVYRVRAIEDLTERIEKLKADVPLGQARMEQSTPPNASAPP